MRRWLGLVALLCSVLGALSAHADVTFTVGRLRTHCAACHAVGELRFLHSDDDEEVWENLFREKAPHSQKIWAQAILEVLDWPTDAPPPFNQMMKPPDRDWMPKGKKRLNLATDTVDGVSARRKMRDDLIAGYLERD